MLFNTFEKAQDLLERMIEQGYIKENEAYVSYFDNENGIKGWYIHHVEYDEYEEVLV